MLRTITNNRDFRTGYILLGYLIEALSSRADNPIVLRNEIKELKRALRTFSHRDNTVDSILGFEVDRRIIHRDGIDGYIELVEIPEVFDTEESANEFFKEFIELRYYPSAYDDCTGEAFTTWYKLFQRNGSYYVYHNVCFDY